MPILTLILIPLCGLAAAFSAIAAAPVAVAVPVAAAAVPAAAAAAAQAADTTAGWGWPVRPLQVVRPFAVGPYPWSPGHRGVDLAAAPGTSVRSPADGVVTFAGSVAGRGVVVITHRGTGTDLVRSSFEPVRPLAPVGARTAEGQVVAEVAPPGSTDPATPAGHCRAPGCLHWGVRFGTNYVDPMGMIGIRRVVLLPLVAVR